MSDAIITVENLGKKYRIRHQADGQRYVALRDVLAQKLKAPFHLLRQATRPPDHKTTNPVVSGQLSSNPSTEDLWALKDVSFEVKRGEVVGIIGRNGAGKSTLLRILSRITEPTTGRVRLRGRVASLLEVGTGFHPELTGRENIFLNGAILGMSKAEIKRKFDEIVAFAEVEKFLDTPVKRYSSGMYVRLAFAVAAHLEPEILIVDEVLAVGDAEFQKKCLGKMESVSRKEGRTVLFVSHNMRAVQSLCRKGIVLESGSLKCLAAAEEAVACYSAGAKIRYAIEFPVNVSRPCINLIRLDQNELEKGNLVLEIGFTSPFELNPPVPGILLTSSLGTPVFGSNTRFHHYGDGQPKLAKGILRFVANRLPIHPGNYNLSVWLGDWQTDYEEKRDILAFEFKSGCVTPHTPSPESIGFVNPQVNWLALP